MAWLFIPLEFTPLARSNSSQGAVDLPTGSSWPSLPSGPFVTSSGTPSRRPASWLGWKKRSWIRRLSGMTLEPSTASHGAALWIASLGGSRVRTSALLARVLAWKASARGCGESTPGSSLRFDPALSSSKTSRRSRRADSTACSPTLPRSGSMRSGFVSERPTLERLTSASGSSSWPTPRASPNENRTTRHAPTHGKGHGKTLAGEAASRLWPTPNTGESLSGHGRRGGRPGNGRQSGADLNALVKCWPTPNANDWKGSSCIGQRRRQLSEAILSFPHGLQDPTTSTTGARSSQDARTLNPRFVEWLMGWPIESTDCGFSATA